MTNDHLQSILRSPFFKARSEKVRPSILGQGSNGSQLGQIQKLLERPMDYFKQRVLLGTATLDTAKACLTHHELKFTVLDAANYQSLFKSSDVASVMLNWLWSSGIAETGSFLKDHQFVSLLTPFLVAEGYSNLICRWIMQLEHDNKYASFVGRNGLRRHMFCKMIQCEARIGAGIASSLKLFLQEWSKIMSPTEPSHISHGLFSRAGDWLCVELDRAVEDNRIELCEYREFYQTVSYWSKWPLYHRGLLELNHPTLPIANSALRHLRQWTPEMERRTVTVRLGLKTTEFLLSKNSQTDALWVIDFLKSNFGEELGLSSVTEAFGSEIAGEGEHTREAEQNSIQSLEALEIH